MKHLEEEFFQLEKIAFNIYFGFRYDRRVSSFILCEEYCAAPQKQFFERLKLGC